VGGQFKIIPLPDAVDGACLVRHRLKGSPPHKESKNIHPLRAEPNPSSLIHILVFFPSHPFNTDTRPRSSPPCGPEDTKHEAPAVRVGFNTNERQWRCPGFFGPPATTARVPGPTTTASSDSTATACAYTEHEDNALAGPSNGPGTQEAENTQTGQDPADTDADADGVDNVNDLLDIDDDGVEQFDPATLANLAALSRIAQDEGLDEGEAQVEDAELLEVPTEGLSRDQVRELVENLRAGAREGRGDEADKEEGGVAKSREDGQARREQGADDSGVEDREDGAADREDVSDGEVDDEVNEDEDGERDEPGDEDYKEGKYFYEKGKLKRRRNRTVL
jgi:hypothetical protein